MGDKLDQLGDDSAQLVERAAFEYPAQFADREPVERSRFGGLVSETVMTGRSSRARHVPVDAWRAALPAGHAEVAVSILARRTVARSVAAARLRRDAQPGHSHPLGPRSSCRAISHGSDCMPAVNRRSIGLGS